jgi:hypothetical protein
MTIGTTTEGTKISDARILAAVMTTATVPIVNSILSGGRIIAVGDLVNAPSTTTTNRVTPTIAEAASVFEMT